eukprot:scaffold2534_cov260-Pinguiococcus_pyrenoidosus.AAC.11
MATWARDGPSRRLERDAAVAERDLRVRPEALGDAAVAGLALLVVREDAVVIVVLGVSLGHRFHAAVRRSSAASPEPKQQKPRKRRNADGVRALNSSAPSGLRLKTPTAFRRSADHQRLAGSEAAGDAGLSRTWRSQFCRTKGTRLGAKTSEGRRERDREIESRGKLGDCNALLSTMEVRAVDKEYEERMAAYEVGEEPLAGQSKLPELQLIPIDAP